jgi:transcriptional accessory protein Tex/SPT6
MVKVEPKHLGVGMYQHDVSEKQLNSTLDEVVSECVSFVGVHVNTASLSVLRSVIVGETSHFAYNMFQQCYDLRNAREATALLQENQSSCLLS